MSGNVAEWCSDRYDHDYYSASPRNNPQGPISGSTRVKRGGSWYSGWPSIVETALRRHEPPGFRDEYLGFRLTFSRDYK